MLHAHRMAPGRAHDSLPPRHDPTGTLPIIRRFVAEARRRSERLKGITRDFVLVHDYLGLKAASVGSIHHVSSSGGSTLDAFARFFGHAAQQILFGGNGAWINSYIAAGYAKGASDAAKLVHAKPEIDPDRIAALSAADQHQLNGIADATEQQAVRVVGEGLQKSDAAPAILRAINERIDAIGFTRMKALAHFAVVGAHASGSLATYKANQIERVSIIAERLPPKQKARIMRRLGDRFADQREPQGPKPSEIRTAEQAEEKLQALEEVEVLTAGDDDVCEECEDISDEGPYPIDEAEGLIPAHPNCRCAFVPSQDARFASVHEEE